ncbi:hypothetical protein COT47_03175 [Candidatus Woesearchaeota archaeon CG08_land_8_20_14_0_20_43_7]|nr:MAG: hypothetical protein COT47_03175 [Candidatus Woesearchaeota archaeon CG08_land_8_20_14_0_20_43_7]
MVKRDSYEALQVLETFLAAVDIEEAGRYQMVKVPSHLKQYKGVVDVVHTEYLDHINPFELSTIVCVNEKPVTGIDYKRFFLIPDNFETAINFHGTKGGLMPMMSMYYDPFISAFPTGQRYDYAFAFELHDFSGDRTLYSRNHGWLYSRLNKMDDIDLPIHLVSHKGVVREVESVSFPEYNNSGLCTLVTLLEKCKSDAGSRKVKFLLPEDYVDNFKASPLTPVTLFKDPNVTQLLYHPASRPSEHIECDLAFGMEVSDGKVVRWRDNFTWLYDILPKVDLENLFYED